MRLLASIGLALVVAACASTPPVPSSPSAPPTEPAPPPGPPALTLPTEGFRVLGYHAWWTRDAWRRYDWSVIDKLIFHELSIDANGQITNAHGWPNGASIAGMIETAQAQGIPVVPALTLFDAAAFDHLFASGLRRRLLMESTMQALRAGGADGVHLDVEVLTAVSDEARDGFHRFVRDLKAALEAYRPGAQLTLFLPAFDYGEVYDERVLAELADLVVVQGYDLHWAGGPVAGPVAPLRGWQGLNWERIVGRYRDLGVPLEKVVLSVPYYGYEWPTETDALRSPTRERGRSITYARLDSASTARALTSVEERTSTYDVRRDSVSGSPYYVFEDSTGWRQGWFEDAESLAEKYRFIRDQGLAGVAVFPLAYDRGRLAGVLREARMR